MQTNNVQLARRYLGDLWTRGRLDAVTELAAPGCTVRDPLVGEYAGVDELAAHVRELRRAFPDLVWSIDEVVADAGPQVALTWSLRGTHRGPLAGLRPTGHAVHVSGLLLLRIEHDQLTAITSRWDPQELLRQLIATEDDSELDAQWEL